MAGISTKGLYGVIATYYIYKNQEKGSIKSYEIAQSMSLPQNYLEQILLVLKKNNILKSNRGASGGYVLAKNGEQISILEIIEVLDGAICEFDFGSRECLLLSFWSERSKKVKELFNVTLAELDKYSSKNEEIVYMI